MTWPPHAAVAADSPAAGSLGSVPPAAVGEAESNIDADYEVNDLPHCYCRDVWDGDEQMIAAFQIPTRDCRSSRTLLSASTLIPALAPTAAASYQRNRTARPQSHPSFPLLFAKSVLESRSLCFVCSLLAVIRIHKHTYRFFGSRWTRA